MASEDTGWLLMQKEYLYHHNGGDLYEIIYETLSRNRMSYLAFLKMASEGKGVSPSEGNGNSLDQDWDIPEEFDKVIFFFGEFESSSMSPSKFASLMQYITDIYTNAYPEDKKTSMHSIEQLKARYC